MVGVRLVFLTFVLLVGSQSATAETRNIALFPSNAEISRQLQAYHLDPDADKALRLLETLDVEKLIAGERATKRRHARAVLVAYYAHVFGEASAGSLAISGSGIATLGSLERFDIFITALGLSGHPETEFILSQLNLPDSVIQKVLPKSADPYGDMTISSGPAMDIIWGAFFGSGNQKYLEKIVRKLEGWKPPQEIGPELRALKQAVDRGEPGSKEAVMAIVLPQAAFGTLLLAAPHYPAVRETLVRLHEQEPGLRRAILTLVGSAKPIERK